MKLSKEYIKDNQSLAILVLIAIGVIIFLGFNYVSSHKSYSSSSDPMKIAQLKLQKDEAATIKSLLDVYYVDNGSYPVNTQMLTDDQAANPTKYGNTSVKETKSNMSDLKQFDYQSTGDGKAYKFTYTDLDNKTITVSGNYEKDYH